MPTCPVCEHAVSYERLPTHLQYCGTSERERSRMVGSLEARLAETEDRLRQRLQHLESILDREVTALEGRDRPDRRVR
jgi:hypothetical protein